MKSFKAYLIEYLTDEQRNEFAGVKMTASARSATDHFFGKDNDFVREEIPNHDSVVKTKSEVHQKIESHLGVEIPHESYVKGVAKDKYGRDVKIGKQIKDEKLRNEFANDGARQGVKSTGKHYVSIVRGTEVAGQTNSAKTPEHPTGHSWGDLSCKNVDSGSNKKYLKHEIEHGTVVMRVHDHDGKEIHRATIHPHHSRENKETAYAVNSRYGIMHDSFVKHADDVASRLSGPNKKDLIFKINKHVYNNELKSEILHPNATPEHITKALGDRDAFVRSAAIKHPNATPEHISKALDDKNVFVRSAAIKHPNATPEHITKALGDEKPLVREIAIQHPKATPEHITKALGDKDGDVRATAAEHPNVTPEHISKALEDKSSYVRITAIKHPNATPEHIGMALKDKDEAVRSVAINIQKAAS